MRAQLVLLVRLRHVVARSEVGVDRDRLLPVRDDSRDHLNDLARFDVHEREEDVVDSFFTPVVIDSRTQGFRVVFIDAVHSGEERDEQLRVVLGQLRDEARHRHIT